MTEQQLIDTITKTTYTKDDLARRLNMLREYLEYRYFISGADPSFDDFLIEKGIDTQDSRTMSKWGPRFFNSFGKETLYSMMESLMRSLQQVQMVTLYLSFDPDNAVILRLIQWIRANIEENVLLDLRKNTSLVIGVGIVWRGIYRELSLHYFLDKHREEITKTLTYYATKHVTV